MSTRRRALLHNAVRRHLLARPHHEAVTGHEPVDRHAALGAVRVEHAPRPWRRARAATGCAAPAPPLRAGLEPAAGEDEGRDDGRGLEVGVGVREQRVDGPDPRGEHADRDERVHRGRAVPRVRPGRRVERPGAPEDDRRGERERDPLPAVELERRRPSTGAARAPTARRSRPGGGGATAAESAARPRRPGQRRAVADRLDRADELLRRRRWPGRSRRSPARSRSSPWPPRRRRSLRLRSTRFAHDAQVMPAIGSSRCWLAIPP